MILKSPKFLPGYVRQFINNENKQTRKAQFEFFVNSPFSIFSETFIARIFLFLSSSFSNTHTYLKEYFLFHSQEISALNQPVSAVMSYVGPSSHSDS